MPESAVNVCEPDLDIQPNCHGVLLSFEKKFTTGDVCCQTDKPQNGCLASTRKTLPFQTTERCWDPTSGTLCSHAKVPPRPLVCQGSRHSQNASKNSTASANPKMKPSTTPLYSSSNPCAWQIIMWCEVRAGSAELFVRIGKDGQVSKPVHA